MPGSSRLSLMEGPISFFSSSPLPTLRAFVRSATIAVNFLATFLCTRSREDAVQRWPLVPKAPQIDPSTASSRFASSITMIGFLPPISRWTCLNVGAHASLIVCPTAVEPVNETTLTRGSLRSGMPTFEPLPVTTLKTPGGRPASSRARAKFTTESGVSVAGLMTTVLPHTRAAVATHQECHVDGFLDVSAGLLENLPHLARHVAGVLLLAVAQDLAQAVENFAALRTRHEAP